MQKIPTVFRRDPDDMRHVLPEITPGCEWVFAGEGTATRKYDGTCVALTVDGHWLARREVKDGKPTPEGFSPVERDETTGKMVGWEPAEQSSFWKYLRQAIGNVPDLSPGTYELIGPKINGNPEKVDRHMLVRHSDAERYPAMDCPLGYDELAKVFETLPWEGIVWHHPGGRMAKLKVRDFS